MSKAWGFCVPISQAPASDPGTGALGSRDVYHTAPAQPCTPEAGTPGPCPAPTRPLPQAPAGGLAPCPTAAAARPILGHRQGFILRFLSILNSFIKLGWLLWDVNNYILKSHKPLKWLMLEGIPAASPRLLEGGVSSWNPRGTGFSLALPKPVPSLCPLFPISNNSS